MASTVNLKRAFKCNLVVVMLYTKTYILLRYMYGILKNTGVNVKAE